MVKSFISLIVSTFLLAAPPIYANCSILIVGDSISAAYGMDLNKGWVALLQNQFNQNNLDCQITNASISGDTSAGGAARIEKHLTETKPNIVMVELGGNDGLRGLSPRVLKKNLDTIIDRSKNAGSDVILLGIRIPPNYGKSYTHRFEQVYYQLAEETKIGFVPFLLEGVGDNPDLMQPDGIHPNENAQPIIMKLVWDSLKQRSLQ